MMKTYIIGAGASKSYEKSKTALKMPIANEFFKTYNELDISGSPYVLVGDLINYVNENYHISPIDFINFNMNIEDLHSEIEEKLNNALGTSNPDMVSMYRVYNQLVFLFTSVINEIQNGPASKAHINLVNSIDQDDSIITFNWDTLIDRALSESKNWHTDTGYLIQPKMIFRDGWEIYDNTKKSKIKLIKLHGSTNWLTAHTSFDDKGNIILPLENNDSSRFYIYEFATKPYSCYRGRYLSGYDSFSYGYYPPNIPESGPKVPEGYIIARMALKTPFTPQGVSDESGYVSMPLIIPPIKHKKYSFYGSLFPYLWDTARESIINSDILIILGYSFPKTDTKTNELFTSAFMKRKSIPDVIIVNPYPDLISNKFKMEFGIPDKKIKVYKEYITEEFNFGKLS